MAVWRWTRRILIAVAIVVVLLFAATAAALALVDTAALRGVIERRAEAATGRELRIPGELEISVLPWLGFEVGEAWLANAPGFGEQPMVALDRAELRVRLLPLFRREVVLDRIVLYGLDANLARNAAGQTNWAGLAGEPAPTEQPTPPDSPGGAERPVFRIDGVEIRNANLSWRDATADQSVVLRDLDLTAGAIGAGERTPIRLDFEVEPEGGPVLSVSANTGLSFDTAAGRATLAGLEVAVDARGDAVPGNRLQAGLAADVSVDTEAERAQMANLRLTVADQLTANGAIDVAFGGAEPQFEGRLEVQPFNPRALARALAVELPQPRDDQVLRQAQLSLALRGTPARIEVPSIEGRLDDTHLSGNALAVMGERPAFEARLNADQLDIDRYLAEGTGAGDTDGGVGAGGDPVASIPLESLRGFDAEAQAQIDRLGYSGLDMNDVRVDLTLAKGILTLDRASLAAADGTLGISGRLDARTDTPAVRLDSEIAGMQSEPLLNALLGRAPIVGGLDATFALNTAGATLQDWIDALDGQLGATFRDGALRGFNLAQQLRVLGARLTGSPVEEASAERRTDFSVLKLQATIEDGVLRSDTLDLRAPLLRVAGEGQVDLAERNLDYTARVFVTDTLMGQGGKAAAELKGLEIPVRVSGPFTEPGVDIQLAEALQDRIKTQARQEVDEEKAELKKKTEKAKKKAKDKVEDELRKRLEEALQ